MLKNQFRFFISLFLFFYSFSLFAQSNELTEIKLLNVSYDVTREFYKDFNATFTKFWKTKTGQTVSVNQSHGGSTKQARAVIDGLDADVVTMNQETDIDAISRLGKLISSDWRSKLPYHSAPYSSTILFLVRKGNPKNIRDWNDLVKPGISVIIPNPKTSGNGRYSYLAAWSYALKTNQGDASKAKDFVSRLFKNVPVLDTGGRAASATFIQKEIGDVLLTFESEIFLTLKEIGRDKFDLVVPSLSIEAEAPVSIVDKVVDKKGSRKVAENYLLYLFSPEGQEIAAKHFYRPRDSNVLKKQSQNFPKVRLLTVDEVFGSWQNAQKTHFDDGGVFDQIYGAAK